MAVGGHLFICSHCLETPQRKNMLTKMCVFAIFFAICLNFFVVAGSTDSNKPDAVHIVTENDVLMNNALQQENEVLKDRLRDLQEELEDTKTKLSSCKKQLQGNGMHENNAIGTPALEIVSVAFDFDDVDDQQRDVVATAKDEDNVGSEVCSNDQKTNDKVHMNRVHIEGDASQSKDDNDAAVRLQGLELEHNKVSQMLDQ